MNKPILLYGDDPCAMRQKIDEIKYKLLFDGSVATQNISLAKADELENFLTQELQSSLFSNKTLLILNFSPKLIKSIDKNYETFQSVIKSFFRNKYLILVFVFDNFDKSVKSSFLNSQFFKLLQEFSKIEACLKLKPWQSAERKSFILEAARKYGLNFNNDALEGFLNCFSDDFDDVDSKIKHIQSYLLPEINISVEVINKLFFPGLSLDELCDAVLNSDYSIILKLTGRIKSLYAPLYIFAVVQNKLRKALQIKLLLDQGIYPAQLTTLTGISQFVLNKEIAKLKNVKIESLKNIILRISDIEFKLKSGIVRDGEAIDLLLLKPLTSGV